MKFATKEDIEAPIDYVFSALSDFETFERSAMRRDADVERKDSLAIPGIGAQWQIEFQMRGKPRLMRLELIRFDRPNGMGFFSRVGGLDGFLNIDLVSMSRKRTRMALEIELKPQTLAARLMVQSFKFARGNLNKRFNLKSAEFAKELEERYRRVS